MEEAIIKRTMPHSLEAEQSVIGSMILDREAILKASEIITGEDFYQKQYGIVFDTMVELFNQNEPVDLVTLQDRLRAKEVPEEISSMEFMRDILDSDFRSTNIKKYANIVEQRLYDSHYTMETLIYDNIKTLKMCQLYNVNYLLIDDNYCLNIDF